MIRGKHSTGILSVDKDNGCSYIKNATHALDFLAESEVRTWFNKLRSSKALLGHNRAATIGAVNSDNAHPFLDRHITLMHNGTLTHTYGLPDHEDFSVDSAAVSHSVAEIGIEETTARMVGAWALVWTDSKQNTINFCRNDERPLWFARLRTTHGSKKALNKWVYASEKGMLDWIIKRNSREVVNYFQIKPGILMTFDMDGDFSSFRTSKLDYKADEAATKAALQRYVAGYSRPKHATRVGTTPATNANNTGSASRTPGTSHGGSLRPKGQALQKVGNFSRGDYVPFWPISFELSDKFKSIEDDGAQGVVEGIMCEDPYHKVRLTCVRVSSVSLRWNDKLTGWVLRDGEYSARLVSMVPNHGEKDNKVILRSDTIKLEMRFEGGNGVPLALGAPPSRYIGGTASKEENDKDNAIENEDQESFDDLEDAELFHMNQMADEEKHRNVIPFADALDMVRGPGGFYIPKSRYLELTKEGCSNCPDPIDVEDAEDIAWVDSDMPVCVQCTKTFELKQRHNHKKAN